MLFNDSAIQRILNELLAGRTDLFGPVKEAIRVPVDKEHLPRGQMIGHRGVLPFALYTLVGSDTLMMVEYFHSVSSSSDVDRLTEMFERDGVEVVLVRNVAVGLYLGHRPC